MSEEKQPLQKTVVKKDGVVEKEGLKKQSVPEKAQGKPVQKSEQNQVQKTVKTVQKSEQGQAQKIVQKKEQKSEKSADFSEPPLPPEDPSEVTSSPIEADEIERAAAAGVRERLASRRRLRSASSTPVVKEESPVLIQIKKIVAYVRQSLLIKLLFSLIFLVSLVAYGIYSIPSIVETQLPKILAKDGISLKSFKVKTLGMSGAELVNLVASSGEVRIRTVRLKYSLSQLWQEHKVTSMEIIGMTLNAKISQEKMSFGGIEGLLTSSVSGNGKSLLIDSLKISSGQFVITRQDSQTPFMLNFDSKGGVRKNSIKLDTDFSLLDERFSVKGTMLLDKSEKSTQIKADISEGNVLSGDKIVGAVTGTLAVSIQDSRLTEAKANLSIETSEQAFVVNTMVIPHEDNTFSLDSSFNRSFKEGIDPGDSFIGNIALKSDKIVFSGTTERFALSLPLNFSILNATNGMISIEKLNTDLQGQLNCMGLSNCIYRLTSNAPLTLNQMQYKGTFNDISLAEPLSFFFQPEEKFLMFQKGILYLNSALSPFSLATEIKKKDKMSTLSSTTKALSQLSVAYNLFTGAANGKMTVPGADLNTQYFSTPQMSVMANFTQSSLQSANFMAKDIHLTQKGIIAPFDAQIALAPANDDEYTLDSAFQMKEGRLSARAKGTYNFRNNNWSLFVEAPKTTFNEQEFPFGLAFPSLAKRFSMPVEGTLALNGRVNINDGKITGAMKFLAKEFTAQIGTYSLANVTTVLNIISLSPFETSENQSIFIGQADVGIPFKNVSMTFKASPEGVLISSIATQYADANFRLIKPVLVPYAGKGGPFVLEGQGISFSRLSELLNVQGLDVDGMGDIRLQVMYDNGNLSIDDSSLYLRKNNSVGGMFRYNPETPVASLDPRMSDFLKSVVFQNLVLTMKGTLTDNMNFNFMLDGYSSSDENQTPRKISLDFVTQFSKVLKPDGDLSELPLGLQRSIQENFK